MKYDCLKLENQLCFPIYLCSKEIIRHYTPYLKELNLTYTQYIVMLYLWENNSSNIKEIGNKLMLESNTLTPLLKKLEEKEYIKREKNTKDERNLIISLTNTGLKLKEKAINIPEKISKCVNLNKEESIALYKLLYKILKNIEEE